jgi:hypothetical protein
MEKTVGGGMTVRERENTCAAGRIEYKTKFKDSWILAC